MRVPRPNGRFDQKPPTRWTRLPDLAAARVSHRKRIFAVVSPTAFGHAGRKAVRRVLIFDNHPATLQLLHDVDLAEREKTIWHIAVGVVLAASIVLGIFLLLL